MLYPIYDTPTNMLFTQGAIHVPTIVLSQILVLAGVIFQEILDGGGEHLYRP